MTTILYILLALVIIIAVLSIIAPKGYNVNRSVTIDQPISTVFDFLRYLKNQEKWSPWEKKDPNMKKDFKGTDGQVGAINKWEGNKEVGTGEQEITLIAENEVIESRLRFFKPWKSESDAYLMVNETEGGQTNVTWGFRGKNKFPVSIMMLFMNMDKAIGKDFDEGLANLKKVLEA